MSFIDIPAAIDRFPLVGTLFDAQPGKLSVGPSKVCIIANATGISQAFYAPFARHLASLGIVTLTFDYRYTGLSFFSSSEGGISTKPISQADKIEILKKHQDVSLETFGKRDIAGVITYVNQRYRGNKVYYIGHSLGAHVLPLAGQTCLNKLHKVLFVSATNPYTQDYADPDRSTAHWRSMMEFVDKNGYFDGRSFGMGGLLPAAALRMWAQWTSFQQYAAGDPAFRDIYRDFRMSFTSLAFSDDVQVMLSPHTVKNWCKSLSNAPSTLIMYDAEQFGLQIGHNDAFRERNQTLWERSFDKWVNDESMEGAASSSRSLAKL